MRDGVVWAAALAVALSGGCGTATGPAADPRTEDTAEEAGVPGTSATEVKLPFGGEARVGGALLRFADVVEDSRCPVDLTCVWEGNAAVELSLRAEGEAPLHLVVNTRLEPLAAEAAGLRISLVELLPLPDTRVPLDEEDYVVRLRVEPIS